VVLGLWCRLGADTNPKGNSLIFILNIAIPEGVHKSIKSKII